MNTLKHIALRRNTRRHGNRAMVAASLIAALMGWNVTALADPSPSDVKSARVNLKDLDLSSANGRNAAYERLHQAARTLCSRVADPNDLSRQTNFVACVDRAMAQAQPALQLLADRGAVTHLANSAQR